MGNDPATSVVDPWGKTHDIDNLYIVDGSVFVTSGGVKPDEHDLVAGAALRRRPGRAAGEPAGARMTAEGVRLIDEGLRARLASVADLLIPAADGMLRGERRRHRRMRSTPSSPPGRTWSTVSAARSTPREAWTTRSAGSRASEPKIPPATRRSSPPPSAATTCIPRKRLLGYPGQIPEPVNVDRFPDYADEGLLERVYERGRIYRLTPGG